MSVPWPTFVAIALFGIAEFLYKLAHQSGIDEATFLCVQSGVVFLSLLALSGLGLGWTATPTSIALGFGCGLFAFATALAVLFAVGRGPLTTTSAIRRLGFLVTGVLAIAFLGERLTWFKGLAIALAVAGVLFMARAPVGGDRPHPTAWLALVLSGVLAFGHKLAAMLGVSPSAFLAVQAGTVHLSSHLICRARGGYRVTPAARRIAPICGGTLAVAMVLAILALQRGDALVIIPMLQLGFLVTAPLGFLFAKEGVTAAKLAGIALSAAAVLVFGLAG